MGCFVSTYRDARGNRHHPAKIGEVVIFVPGLRVPKMVDFHLIPSQELSASLADRLSTLRSRIVVMASREIPAALKPRRKTAKHHGGGSPLSELRQALEEYLPVLVGLVKDGRQLEDKFQFEWINQEDIVEETSISNAWYEILSILHLMALLCFLEANLLLLPKSTVDGYKPSISQVGGKSTVIDVLLKGAGYLNCAVRTVLPQIPPLIRDELPVDLREEVLQALCLQALGQCADIQLGMAIDSPKATLAVKRRLACEMMKCWNQAEGTISRVSLTSAWGEKHLLFVKWKTLEAKALAYYYHGLILDEGNSEKSNGMMVTALQAADELLKESQRASELFHAATPLSRNPPLSVSMKYLYEKIPKDALNNARINPNVHAGERMLDTAPAPPDFAVALKPDEYQLPPSDPLWNQEATLEYKA